MKDRIGRGLALGAGIVMVMGCSSLPSQYIRQAEPGVTLTSLTAAPDTYHGKTVILGGVIVDQKQDGHGFWLHLKNRPLDKEYRPHRPTVKEGPEGGSYWVLASSASALPPKWKQWARVTVVGKVLDPAQAQAPGGSSAEPVLALSFMRGWTMGRAQQGVWEESVDANYLMSVPEGLHGE